MDKRKIGLRIHDVAEGLKDHQTTGAATQFKNTLLLGKAASLALHLKGHDVLENMESFEYAAGELGIGLELEYVLRELEEIEFIRRPNNKKIEVNVPVFVDAYEILAERWLDLNPKDSERKTISILNKIENNPIVTSRIVDEFALDERESRIIYELGGSGTYLDQFYTAEGDQVSFSPALTEMNPEKIFAFSEQNSQHDLSIILNEVRKFQGKPIDQISNQTILQAIYSGVLLKTSVGPSKNSHEYIFAPMDKILPENKVILDKARALLSCVRHGQFHVEDSTKIRNAGLILGAMRSRKKLGGHPAHKSQYGLIIAKGIARLSSITATAPSLIIIDTEENLQAIDLAMEMLGTSTGRTQAKNQNVQQVLFQPESYTNPSSSRVKFKKELMKSDETRREIIEKVSLLNQGIHSAFN